MSATTIGWRGWLLDPAPASRGQARLGGWFRAWLAFRRNNLAMTGLAIVLLLVLMAALAPVIADPASATLQVLEDRLQPASWAHPFGTDELGRDILARIMFGARVTLTIVVLVSLIVVPMGLGIGLPAGYFGGVIDSVPGIENAVIAISLTSWPPFARLARAETLTRRRAEFIEAVELQGASHLRIILTQIMPLCLPSVIIRLTLDMAGIILTAAGLGFLGLGAQPPQPEWGAMVSTGRQVLLDQWWVATIPGLAIFITSVGFNLLGDGLRDVADARSA
jgi:peptide/nickel transport system permease protein